MAGTDKKMTLSEQVRMAKLWNDLEKNLKEPFSKEDLENLTLLGEYLKKKYAGRMPESRLEHKDLKGKSVKSLEMMDEETLVCVENKPEGPVFWIRCSADGHDRYVCTNGRSVIEYPKEILSGDENYWSLREYDSKGNITETTRSGDKMKVSHHSVAQEALLNKKKATR